MRGRVWPGIKTALSNWKVILAIYVFQLLLASVLGLQVYQVIDASIGHSLSLEALDRNYDYTVISDFINTHGGSFSPLIGQIRWIVLAYLVFGAFISAGLLHIIVNGSKEYIEFFKGGALHFGRFFAIDVIFAFLVLAVLAVAFGITGYLFGIAPTRFANELPFLRYTALVFVIALLLCIVLIVSKNLGKMHYLRSDDGLFRSVLSGFRHFWKHKWKSLRYSTIFLFISVGLLFFNHATGAWALLAMVIVQQLIVLFKLIWRYSFYQVLSTFKSGEMTDVVNE